MPLTFDAPGARREALEAGDLDKLKALATRAPCAVGPALTRVCEWMGQTG